MHDLDERTEVRFSLKDIPAHVEHFGFILGVQKRTFRDQDPANIKAAELVGRLHDALHAANYRGHDLERFLVRIVLDARAAHQDATLATLYDPDLMPPNLRKAHQALDRAVDRLYRRGGFSSERERIEHLFALYEKMRAPLTTSTKQRERRKR